MLLCAVVVAGGGTSLNEHLLPLFFAKATGIKKKKSTEWKALCNSLQLLREDLMSDWRVPPCCCRCGLLKFTLFVCF